MPLYEEEGSLNIGNAQAQVWNTVGSCENIVKVLDIYFFMQFGREFES